MNEQELKRMFELWQDRLTVKEIAWHLKKPYHRIYIELKRRSLIG
jgi:hypothetical protein